MNSKKITWLLEKEIFDDYHTKLEAAAKSFGHEVIHWNDEWWQTERWPHVDNMPVVFHGSLGNAHRINSELDWIPGAFCNTNAFYCSNWYNQASKLILNNKHIFTTVKEFTDNPDKYFDELECSNEIFVRPDSPLKPFSGRVLSRKKISLRSLDHGFYYDDIDLPVVLSSVQQIGEEWRYVVSGNNVITGSTYQADGRRGTAEAKQSPSWDFAVQAANKLMFADGIYILDVCSTKTNFKILEVNPFSGADLYNCDREKVVQAVTDLVV